MKILFYDVETTGLDHRQNAIIQLSALMDIDGAVVESFNCKMKPFEGAVIEPTALEANRTTAEEIATYVAPEIAYASFIHFLDRNISKFDKSDKAYLCGFNNRAFDDHFLRAFFTRNRNSYFGSYFWSNSLDCIVLATLPLAEIRPRMASFNLSAVAGHLGIYANPDRLHDALYDVCITREVFYKTNPGAEYVEFTCSPPF